MSIFVQTCKNSVSILNKKKNANRIETNELMMRLERRSHIVRQRWMSLHCFCDRIFITKEASMRLKFIFNLFVMLMQIVYNQRARVFWMCPCFSALVACYMKIRFVLNIFSIFAFKHKSFVQFHNAQRFFFFDICGVWIESLTA